MLRQQSLVAAVCAESNARLRSTRPLCTPANRMKGRLMTLSLVIEAFES